MIVVDANVVLSGLRSSRGASHALLRRLLNGDVAFAVSPSVVIEYEDVLKRPGILGATQLGHDEIDVVLDGLTANATLVSNWFRFRPFLNDPKDDLYIECAMAAGARTIVTSDRHFGHPAVAAFGLNVMNAGGFEAELKKRRRPL